LNPFTRLSVIRSIGTQIGVENTKDYGVHYLSIFIVLVWTFLFVYLSYKLLKIGIYSIFVTMNYIKNLLIVVFICCLSGKINAQYIDINDQKTPQQLVEDVLVNSSCVSITNASGKGDNFTPSQNSFAYFNAGTSKFPFAEGVVLTTSTSRNAVGPYSSYLGEGSPEWLGDPDLDQALGINSINATVLEFDYVPLTDFLSFNYIFASNEYQFFYPCVYSDGFAFLIKEAGTNDAYKNLAVLPNTTTPVSSTIVHPTIAPSVAINGDRYDGCPAINENYFNGLNNNRSPINYAGQTIVMNAQTSVVAGKKYHIKLVIADDKIDIMTRQFF
jgi:hypothetical protein